MKEPPPIAILSARLARAFPSLSTYSCAALAAQLEAVERAQRRHAERVCSSPEDGGYSCLAVVDFARAGRQERIHDPEAQRRAGERIAGKVKALVARIAELHGKAWTFIEHTHSAWRCTLQDVVAHKHVFAEWTMQLQHDPRGPVLLLKLPGEAEAVAV